MDPGTATVLAAIITVGIPTLGLGLRKLLTLKDPQIADYKGEIVKLEDEADTLTETIRRLREELAGRRAPRRFDPMEDLPSCTSVPC